MAYSLYYFGDLISKPMYWSDLFARIYPVYNWIMWKAAEYQDAYGLDGPWEMDQNGEFDVDQLEPEEE